MLMAIGLALTLVCTVAYVVGSELCLPAARYMLRSGDAGPWMFACRLVSTGEWALIVGGVSVLLIANKSWQIFAGSMAVQVLSIGTASILLGSAVWEVSGRTRRNQGRAMSLSLDMALPAKGKRRDVYEHTHRLLEVGSRRTQYEVFRAVLKERDDTPVAHTNPPPVQTAR